MTEYQRDFITNTGSIYSQIKIIDKAGKVTSETWKRDFKKENKISIENIKSAVYLATDYYDSSIKGIKGDKKSKLVELSKSAEYQGANGIILFLAGNGEFYTSSIIKKINPPYENNSPKQDTPGSSILPVDDISDMIIEEDEKDKKKA